MLGITSSREEAEYSLDLNEKAQPIKQWLLHFTQDRKESIRVEVTQLLAAGFIREVTRPNWLVNPVLVKKMVNGERVSTAPISTNTALRILSPYHASTMSLTQ